jgi:hypothetical protein
MFPIVFDGSFVTLGWPSAVSPARDATGDVCSHHDSKGQKEKVGIATGLNQQAF